VARRRAVDGSLTEQRGNQWGFAAVETRNWPIAVNQTISALGKGPRDMNRRTPLILLVAFASLAVPAVVAAAEPALSTTVIPGQEIDVTGTGFPGDADVLLVIEGNGAAAGSLTLRTDAAGSFTVVIDAGPGRGGVYTLIATSGSAKAVAEVVAVETAGGGGTGAQPTLPAGTDTAIDVAMRPAPANEWAIVLLAALLGLSLAPWFVSRSNRRRAAADR
jgi:hypothetical protein